MDEHCRSILKVGSLKCVPIPLKCLQGTVHTTSVFQQRSLIRGGSMVYIHAYNPWKKPGPQPVNLRTPLLDMSSPTPRSPKCIKMIQNAVLIEPQVAGLSLKTNPKPLNVKPYPTYPISTPKTRIVQPKFLPAAVVGRYVLTRLLVP